MRPPLLYDAVVFDLDGTLVATHRFWAQAARTGARSALAALGVAREVPSPREWMALVGRPADEAFATLFPELPPAARAAIREACFAEERRLLAAGGASLMPGAEETLRTLRAAGLRLAIASNCSAPYLAHMQDALGLRALVAEARCLDSPGVADKADMVEQVLAALGTRRALMVGDRGLDRDAAWANGLPHVHCAFGFAPPDEDVAAEAVIEDLGELPALLARRAAWIERALALLGALPPPLPFVLGIDGPPAAGKTLFASDVVRLLRGRRVPAGAVSLEAFRRPGANGGPDPARDPLGAAYDLDALRREVLDPAARGEPVRVRRTGGDRRGLPVLHAIDVPARAVLVLEGPFLADPRLRPRIDRLLRLEVPEALVLRRVGGREGRAGGPEPLERLRSVELPARRAFDLRHDPARLADLVLDAANPLGA
ncbi:MAG: HAD family hydrolase [Planctomycetota bacterium]